MTTAHTASASEHPQDRLGERYTRAALYTLAGAVASRWLVLLQGIVVARHLGTELFGIFSILVAVTMLVTSLSGFGLGWALIKYVPECLVKERQRAESILTHCLTAVLLSALAVGALFFLSAPLLAQKVYHRPALTGYLRLSAFIVLVLTLFNMAGAILTAFQRFGEYAWRMAAGYAFQFLAVWLGVSSFGLRGALIGLLVGPMVGVAVVLAAGKKAAQDYGLTLGWKEWKWSWPVMRSILNFSIPVLISSYIVAPVFWAANTILALKKGFVEVGLFNVAFVFYQAVLFVPQNLSLPSLPLFSEIQASEDRTRFNRMLNRNLRGMWVVTLPICFALALGGRMLVVPVYGKEYEAAGSVVFFTSFTALFYVIDYTIQVPMIILGRVWDFCALSAIWTAIILGLAWYWIPGHGGLGLGAAYFVSFLVLGILLLVYTERRLNFRFGGNLRITWLTLGVIGAAYAGVFHFSKSLWLLMTLLGPMLVWAEWKWVFDEEDRKLARAILGKAMIGLIGGTGKPLRSIQ